MRKNEQASNGYPYDMRRRRTRFRFIVLTVLMLSACTFSSLIPRSCMTSGCAADCAGGMKGCDCGCVNVSTPGQTGSAEYRIHLPYTVSDLLTQLAWYDSASSEEFGVDLLTGISDSISMTYGRTNQPFLDCMAGIDLFIPALAACRPLSPDLTPYQACLQGQVGADPESLESILYCRDAYESAPRSLFDDCLVSGERCLLGPAEANIIWPWVDVWRVSHPDNFPRGLVIGYQGDTSPALLVLKYHNKVVKNLLSNSVLGVVPETFALLRSLLPAREDMTYISMNVDPIPLDIQVDVGACGGQLLHETMYVKGMSFWLGKTEIKPGASFVLAGRPIGMDLDEGDLAFDYDQDPEPAETNHLVGLRLRVDKLEFNLRVEGDQSGEFTCTAQADVLLDLRTGIDSGAMTLSPVRTRVYWRTTECHGWDLIDTGIMTDQVKKSLQAVFIQTPRISIEFEERLVRKALSFVPDENNKRNLVFSAEPLSKHFLNLAVEARGYLVESHDGWIRPYLTVREHASDTDPGKIVFEGQIANGASGVVVPSAFLSGSSGSEFSLEVTSACIGCAIPEPELPNLTFPYDTLPRDVTELMDPPQLDWIFPRIIEEPVPGITIHAGPPASMLEPPNAIHEWGLRYPADLSWIDQNVSPMPVGAAQLVGVDTAWPSDPNTIFSNRRVAYVTLAMAINGQVLRLPFYVTVLPFFYSYLPGIETTLQPIYYSLPPNLRSDLEDLAWARPILRLINLLKTPFFLDEVFRTCGPEILKVYPGLMQKDFQLVGEELEILASTGVMFRHDADGQEYWAFDSPRFVGPGGMVIVASGTCQNASIRFKVRQVPTLSIKARPAARTYLENLYHPSDDLSPATASMLYARQDPPGRNFEGMIELPAVTVSVAGADPTKAIRMDNWMYDAWDQEREKKFEFGILGDRNQVVLSYPQGVGLLPKELRRLDINEIRLVNGVDVYRADNPDLIRQVMSSGFDYIEPDNSPYIDVGVLMTMKQQP
ncbi:MAG: hypothetical protein GYA21_02005 [Myxococcales bacterium]|nr:hypothetical protein [Myxococcales bacterium]